MRDREHQFDFDEIIDRRVVPALKPHPIVLGPDGADLFPAGVADMDFRPPPPVLDALQERLNHGVFGYETVPDGLYPALTDWMARRHGWSLDQDHILRAPNILNALAIAARILSTPGDGVIVQPPVFFDFFDILKENDRTILENPLLLRDGRYEMDFDGLEKRAADPRAKLIYLCNPHNPVGRVWTAQELRRLSEICARHGVTVVSDEMHGDLTFPGHPYTPFATLGADAAANSITCLSPAKSFNIAACCSAFTIIPDAALRKQFQAENSRLTVNKNNAFASVAMEAAYRAGEPWLEAVVAYLQGNLDLVRNALQSIEGVHLIEPEGTFLLWLDCRDLGLSPEDLVGFLRRDVGWAPTRGVAFGQEGAGFVRFNIACPRARLRQAMDNLQRALPKP